MQWVTHIYKKGFKTKNLSCYTHEQLKILNFVVFKIELQQNDMDQHHTCTKELILDKRSARC